MKLISGIFVILFVLMTITTALAAEYCPSSYQTSSVYVQYANLTPALNAEVTIVLWNGSQYLMANVGGGIYNHSYYVPAYNGNGSNSYVNTFNSSNPTTSGAEDFTVKSTCATTNGSTSYMPMVVAIATIMFAMFYIGITLKDDHFALKLMFIWVGIFLFVPLTQVAYLIASAEYLDSRIQSMANTFHVIAIWIAIVASAYFMIYLTLKLLGSIKGLAKNPLRTEKA